MAQDEGMQTVRCGDCLYLEPTTPAPGDPLGSGYRCSANESRLIGHVYDLKPLWCPKDEKIIKSVLDDQGEQPRAGGTGSRWLTLAVRYFLVSILPLILALIALVALLWMRPASGAEHPFGEAGTMKRQQAQAEVTEQLRRAYYYAFHWATANRRECPERIPAAVFCRDTEELAARTGCPLSDRGGRVVGRADIETNTIYLCRPDAHALYHECYHTMFESWNERNAEAFAVWCVKMDAQLEELKRGARK